MPHSNNIMEYSLDEECGIPDKTTKFEINGVPLVSIGNMWGFFFLAFRNNVLELSSMQESVK